MTQHRDLKRVIRARMLKTGEAYTTARLHVLGNSPNPRKTNTSVDAPERPRRSQPAARRVSFNGRRRHFSRRSARRLDWLPIAFASPAVLLFLVAVLAGCTPNGERTAERRATVTVLPDDVHVVGTSESIARIVDLQPAADGRVWILNSIEPFFVVLGPAGQVEQEFGRSGGGPAEFGAPLVLVRGADRNEVWTYDLLRHALIRLSADRRTDLLLPRDSLSPPQLVSFAGAGLFPAPPWLEAEGRGFVVGRVRQGSAEPFTGEGLWSADIVLIRPETSAPALELHTAIADLLGAAASRYPGATKFLPYPLWTVCAGSTVALYDPLVNALWRIGQDEADRTTVALPSERRVRITLDRLFGIAYRRVQEDGSGLLPDSVDLRRQFEAMYREWEGRLADVFPEYADMRCAPDGTLWLQPFNVATGPLGRGPEWYMIAVDGSRTTVILPDEFTPFRFEADRIWGSVRDGVGVSSAAWIGQDALR